MENSALTHRPLEYFQKTAAKRRLTSDELLELKSRTFYHAIHHLDLSRSPYEFPLADVVGNLYNWLRELDEGEDATLRNAQGDFILPPADRMGILTKISTIASDVARANNPKEVHAIIKGENLEFITKELSKAIQEPRARLFVEQFAKGHPLEMLHSFDRNIRDESVSCIQGMAHGMNYFLGIGQPKNMEDLDKYDYEVAGRLGYTLTKLVNEKNKQILDKLLEAEQGQLFGAHLQLTNILKGLRGDYNENRAFVPTELIPEGMMYKKGVNDKGEDLVTGTSKEAQKAREHVFTKFIDLIKSKDEATVKYLQSIPSILSGYKSFCFDPYLSAKATLELMMNAGPEKIFAGDQKAVKIAQETYSKINKFSAEIPLYDDGNHANEILEEIRQKPESHSFLPGSNDWLDKYVA